MTRFLNRAAPLVLAALLAGGPALAADAPALGKVEAGPSQVLFWPQAKRDTGFAHMEDTFPMHVVKRGKHVHPLPVGKPLDMGKTVDDFMAANHTSGVLIIQNGKIRLEKYGLGFNEKGRWTSFSVAKSFTSTLVGAAVKDGYIKSLDAPVTDYIKGLKGSAYEGVTVRQILTMTSGVKWNEDYADPKSDVALLFAPQPDPTVDPTVAYMKTLPREAEPGKKWVYKTGETNLIGILVTAATHKTLAQYLSEKVWKPFGMEQDAVWMTDPRGQEAGGCCLSVSLHDYGRMGLFILGGGKAGGKSVLPKTWIADATHKQAETGAPGGGYGYQWWTEDNGTFNAFGIFGQSIHFDAKRGLVIVITSSWPKATDHTYQQARESFVWDVTNAVDKDAEAAKAKAH